MRQRSDQAQMLLKLVLCFLVFFPLSPNGVVFAQNQAQAGSEEPDDGEISLDFKGIDLLEVFRIFSLKMGTTIVPSKNVIGRVNLFLNGVTFDDALDVIIMTQNLALERKGDILMIMTNDEYRARYGKNYDETRAVENVQLTYAQPSKVFDVLNALKSDIGKVIVDEGSGTVVLIDIPEKIELMKTAIVDMDRPLFSQTFELKYANITDIEEHLRGAITEGSGKLFIDNRTNKVVVSDLPKKMEEIKGIVQDFDEESREVFIEADIVQINLKKEYQQGIDWQKVFTRTYGATLTGTIPAAPSFTPTSDLSTSEVALNVGTLAEDKFEFMIQFIRLFGDTKILSSPKIAVVNNEEAKILVGSREAYITQSQSQAESTTVTSESVEFIDVGVKLSVVPTINKDGFITMKIKPEVSNVRETLVTSLGSSVPIVETSEAETVVKVKDGTVIMIAGLMKKERRKDSLETPFLSKIPLIGELFKSRAELDKNTELVIFLKPRIISGDSAIAGVSQIEYMPPEMWGPQKRKDFIAQEIEKIRFGAQSREDAKNKEDILKGAQVVPDLEQDIIQQKLKGAKVQ